MNARKAKHGGVLTFVFSLISLIYVFPIVLVLINSFKKKAYISRKPFAIPSGKMYVGLENYVNGINRVYRRLLDLSFHYGSFGGGYHHLHFHVRMVYFPGKK